MSKPSVKYSYASRTLCVRVQEGEDLILTLGHPLWSETPQWAVADNRAKGKGDRASLVLVTGESVTGYSLDFPREALARALDECNGVLASEVWAATLEDRTLHVLKEIRNAIATSSSDVASLNRICSTYDGPIT